LPARSSIPSAVIIVVSDIVAGYYYSHRKLNSLFVEAGAPGDPPEGNCQEKCASWLKRCNADPSVDPFTVLGSVLTHYMEIDYAADTMVEGRKRVENILAKHGLSYRPGGRILGATVGAVTRSLEEMIRARDFGPLALEFDRALESVEKDPPSALTAACATLETLCKVYIEDEKLPMPEKATIKPLWSVVQKSLGLDPKSTADDDINRILSGLSSVVDGIGSWRTHAGSAHGRGRQTYRPAPRHARLAIHAAHTLATFLIETWDDRKAKRTS
jgi:hypothetical protein